MATQDKGSYNGNRSAFVHTGDPEIDAMKAGIRQTEARITEIIEAIREKLSFDNLQGRAEEKIREVVVRSAKAMMRNVEGRARDVGHNMMDTIKENPVPLVLMGAGLTWLLMESSRWASRRMGEGGRYLPRLSPERYEEEGRYWIGPENMPDDFDEAGIEYDFSPGYRQGRQYGERRGKVQEAMGTARERMSEAQQRAREVAGQVREGQRRYGAEARDRVQEAVETAREKVGEVQHRVGEMAGRVMHKGEEYGREAGHYAQRRGGGIWETLQEKPLAVSVAAIAIGVLVGLKMPEMRRERPYRGYSGTGGLSSRVRQVAGEARERVGRVAQEAMHAGKGEAERQFHPSGGERVAPQRSGHGVSEEPVSGTRREDITKL